MISSGAVFSMASTDDQRPSFCMLIKQASMDKLLMPRAFMKEHKKMLAKTCLLKTNEGMLWLVKIVREKSDFFICEKEWPRFVAYHKLELGDILLFSLTDKYMFLVCPYTKKIGNDICGSRVIFEELSSSEDEKEGDVEPSRKPKGSSESEVSISRPGAETEDSEVDSDDDNDSGKEEDLGTECLGTQVALLPEDEEDDSDYEPEEDGEEDGEEDESEGEEEDPDGDEDTSEKDGCLI